MMMVGLALQKAAVMLGDRGKVGNYAHRCFDAVVCFRWSVVALRIGDAGCVWGERWPLSPWVMVRLSWRWSLYPSAMLCFRWRCPIHPGTGVCGAQVWFDA